MLKKKNEILTATLLAAVMLLTACSDYDNGYSEQSIKFDAGFIKHFGSYDETQDWNLAERTSVTVVSSTAKNVAVYTEKDGTFVQVGAFKNVSGSQRLEFDVIEGTESLVVSDGEVALRAVIGGTVNFDNQTSTTGAEQDTRGYAYQNRNLWKRTYVVPANITEAERKAVVEEFSKQHYGAYNPVLVPWTHLFVQQVYKGEAKYYDAFNQATGTASDKMNRLLIWDNASGDYIHVNDFNSGNQTTKVYDDLDTEKENPIIGLTLMCEIDATNCPIQAVKDPDGQDVTCVKQFTYHNSQSNQDQPCYIMKNVTWEEDGVKKSGLYLGFDFYATKRADQSADKNMDVERDWIFNDWIVKISQGLDLNVPLDELNNAQPAAWILAGEDLGSGFDTDYNDVVVAVERVAGQNLAHITPLAAGGTLASYLFFTGIDGQEQCVGEIHQLLGAQPAVSGKYQPMNLGSDLIVVDKTESVYVPETWSLSQDFADNNNMGGFTIRVLPAGTKAMDKTIAYADPAFDNAITVRSPMQGEVPYIICLPFTHTVTNSPEEGQKTTTVWEWPCENTDIAKVYADFAEWAKEKTTKTDWYLRPSATGVVNTKSLALKLFGVQPATMTPYEVEQTNNPTTDVSFYEKVPATYPVREVPATILEVKDQNPIYMQEGETIDILDYINTNYPEKVFYTSNDDGAVGSVEGSFTLVKCKQYAANAGTVTLTIKIATPSGVKEVQKTVHYNKQKEDNDGKQQTNLGFENGNQNITVGGSTTATIKTNSDSRAFSVSSDNSSVATATIEGDKLIITGVGEGSTSIWVTVAATATYREQRSNFYVNVTKPTGGNEGNDNANNGLYYNLQYAPSNGSNWSSEYGPYTGNSSISLSSGDHLWIYSKDQDKHEYHRDGLTATYNGQSYTIGTNQFNWSNWPNAIGFYVTGTGTQTVTLHAPATSEYAEQTVTITLNVN